MYRNEIHHSAAERTQVLQDVAADPTLPRTKSVRCSQCGHGEAVFFQVIFICLCLSLVFKPQILAHVTALMFTNMPEFQFRWPINLNFISAFLSYGDSFYLPSAIQIMSYILLCLV